MPLALLEQAKGEAIRATKDGETMKAAIYCRVSTDSQEREGTSLQTQLEACLKYCMNKSYEVSYRYSETFSGLLLERPELDKLRDMVRNEAIDVVICYSLDRLSRDPGHGVIITQEMEKHGVKLETVTEDVDNSELGKLISYIRGYASKVEAQKIRERSMRGKLARAKGGRIPSGSGSTIYGYDYIKVSQKNGGRRVINEAEALWVRKIFEWLVNEGLATSAITLRLRTLNVLTKFGKIWNRMSIQAMLKNPSYMGKTYVFTTMRGRKKFTKPRAEWVEIPGVTPAIITSELFEAAQIQLKINKEKSLRNVKHAYLLSGHIRCRQCGRSYYGVFDSSMSKGKRRNRRSYCCLGRLKMVAPVERCQNHGWNAEKIESMVWTEIERVLSHPEIIITELEKQRHDADRMTVLETELKQVERELKAVDIEQHQLLQWALKGFPEIQVEAENKRINNTRETLKGRQVELEAQIKASQDAIISVPKLECTVELLRQQLKDPDYTTKRGFIESMGIKILLDGESVEIAGFIPMEEGCIVHTPSSLNY